MIFEADSADCAMDVARLRLLLAALPDAAPVALHCDDRFAVHLHRAATDVVDALAVASADMSAALQNVGVAQAQPLRVEVIALEEFERDCRVAYGS